MHGDIDHLALILKLREIRQQNQMPRRRYRQKFGDALD